MKKYISIFVLVFAVMIILLPSGAAAQGRSGKGVDHGRFNVPIGSWQGNRGRGQDRGWDHGRHRFRGRNRNTFGYRNYGQYRRTQVGNRRFRLVRRTYWRHGVRSSRWVRVY